MYKVAKEMGANAVTQFNVDVTYRMNGNLRVMGLEVSGFAIERIEN